MIKTCYLPICFILIFFILACGCSRYSLVNPTGTYRIGKLLRNQTKQRNYGEIMVKALTANKIVMRFVIIGAYPSYPNGTFTDTLDYSENKATYLYPKEQPTCKIDFEFLRKEINVLTKDSLSACDFGQGVDANGTFKKISSKVPKL